MIIVPRKGGATEEKFFVPPCKSLQVYLPSAAGVGPVCVVVVSVWIFTGP